MTEDFDELQRRIAALEQEVAGLKRGNRQPGVRKRSEMSIWGVPLYDIALGPDSDRNEARGHARGIIAIGDIATGVLAIGGLARGFVALGGVALGAIAFGGCSIGLLISFGGFAAGALAFGGCAIGLVAVGGAAVGFYAAGGSAIGKYVIGANEQNPEAIRFFGNWIPGFEQLFRRPVR